MIRWSLVAGLLCVRAGLKGCSEPAPICAPIKMDGK